MRASNSTCAGRAVGTSEANQGYWSTSVHHSHCCCDSFSPLLAAAEMKTWSAALDEGDRPTDAITNIFKVPFSIIHFLLLGSAPPLMPPPDRALELGC